MATSAQNHKGSLERVSSPPPSPLDCGTAFQTIAKNCVHLIQRNRKSAIAADPEAIHAVRIELTRLRAAVLFFSPMIKDAAWGLIRMELSWLNSALGKARDDDVTANYTRRKRYRSWAKPFRHTVVRTQERTHRSLAKKLNSARYHRLIAALNHWITSDLWSQNNRSLRSERVEAFSQARLRDWRTAIRRKGRHLRRLTRKQLHRLRIRCKRYRYVLAALQNLRVNISDQDLAFGEVAKQAHRILGDLRDLRRLGKTIQRRPPHYRRTKRKLLRSAEEVFRG